LELLEELKTVSNRVERVFGLRKVGKVLADTGSVVKKREMHSDALTSGRPRKYLSAWVCGQFLAASSSSR
jgi:hypothetical protein